MGNAVIFCNLSSHNFLWKISHQYLTFMLPCLATRVIFVVPVMVLNSDQNFFVINKVLINCLSFGEEGPMKIYVHLRKQSNQLELVACVNLAIKYVKLNRYDSSQIIWLQNQTANKWNRTIRPKCVDVADTQCAREVKPISWKISKVVQSSSPNYFRLQTSYCPLSYLSVSQGWLLYA